nr:hypothetical protein [Tanacetum cinerariifolium]
QMSEAATWQAVIGQLPPRVRRWDLTCHVIADVSVTCQPRGTTCQLTWLLQLTWQRDELHNQAYPGSNSGPLR